MPVLLVAEHTNAALGSATAKALTAAKLIDAEVHVLVAGHNCGPAAAQAASGDESLGFELPEGSSHDACRNIAFRRQSHHAWQATAPAAFSNPLAEVIDGLFTNGEKTDRLHE